jgi:hypothetical protein
MVSWLVNDGGRLLDIDTGSSADGFCKKRTKLRFIDMLSRKKGTSGFDPLIEGDLPWLVLPPPESKAKEKAKAKEQT